MPTPSTELAAVQLARLSNLDRMTLAAKVFNILEYGAPDAAEGTPGYEWSSDTTQALGNVFRAYGVQFSDPNRLPAGYRFNDHRSPDAKTCSWALRPTPAPHLHTDDPTPPWCPAGCPDSLIEADPAAVKPPPRRD